MEINQISIGLAFIAGLASFLSPCVLSLVPAYISYLGGRAAGGITSGEKRWLTFIHGVFFILGFSTVFILVNIIAAALGIALFDLRIWLARIGGVIVVIFGLHMIGILRIPFLEYDLRVHEQADHNLGFLASFLMGIFFSAGWSPCIGPILGSIMTFAINSGDILQGVFLGSAYSAGMAIPFLAAALGINWVALILRKYSRFMRIIEISMGVLLVIIGFMLLFGVFNLMASFTPFIDFGF